MSAEKRSRQGVSWQRRKGEARKVCKQRKGLLDDAVLCDEDVASLDVAMHDSLAVEELQPNEDLPRVLSDHRLVQRSEVCDKGGDAATGDVLQEDVETTLVCLSPEVLDDVLVLQHLHYIDFSLQRLDCLVALLLVVLEAHLREEDLLHRHELPRVCVDPLVHLGIRPLPDLTAQAPPQQLLVRATEVGAAVAELADRYGLVRSHPLPPRSVRPVRGGREPGVDLLVDLLVLCSARIAFAQHLGRSDNCDAELLPPPPLRQRQSLVQLAAAG
eukprot:445021-Hanusia_phi.AAC.1